MFQRKNGCGNRVGDGCCLDSNRKEYSWYSSSDGDLRTLTRECGLQNNCVGIELREWDANLIGVAKSNGSGS